MNAPDPLRVALESIFDAHLLANVKAAEVAQREYVFARIPLSIAVSVRQLLRNDL